MITFDCPPELAGLWTPRRPCAPRTAWAGDYAWQCHPPEPQTGTTSIATVLKVCMAKLNLSLIVIFVNTIGST